MRRRLVFLTKLSVIALTVVMASCMMNKEDEIPDFSVQLQKDIALIDEYLMANNIPATEDVTGLRYIIHRNGTGTQPTIDSCVTSNYQGLFLSSGVEFDKGTNISFPLNEVIAGWQIGMPLLKEGDSATFFVPSGYAYGYHGYPPEIPSNSNMIFHVGVTKVGNTYKSSTRSCD
jgi:FKBP-type peptidyl-prolyl cis-trans isomerase